VPCAGGEMLSQEAMVSQELYEAANQGNAARLRALLPGLAPEEQAVWLRGAFIRAAYENQVRPVQALLEVGADIEAVDDLGHTSLHWAARRSYDGLAKLLLDRRANVGCQNQDGVTPLHLAVEQNCGPMVQLLLQSAADPSAKTLDKRTALHVAAECGSSVAVAVLLEALPQDTRGGEREGQPSPLLELENGRGETALLRAASRNHAAIAQLLLRAGADPAHGNLWGQGPLHIASLGGHVGSAAVLLDGLADVNLAAQDGATPLHTAVDRSHVQVVELLLSRAADATALAAGGRTPLHTAERGCIEAAEALLASGAEADARTEEARTPLSYAASRGHAEVAQKLLAVGADPQALDMLKQTPLHAAAAAGRVEVADVLICRQVQIEREDAAGRTPILIAVSFRQDSMIRLLLKRGGVLPEKFAKSPELQPLVHEVELEILQEQIREAESGKDKAMIKAAENDFENARLELLRLTTSACASNTAPVLHHAEMQLAAATEHARVSKLGERATQDEAKHNKLGLLDTVAEVKAKRERLAHLRKAVAQLKDDYPKQLDDFNKLSKQIAQGAKDKQALRQQEETLTGEGTAARRRAEDLQVKLHGLEEEGSALAVELARIRAELDKWHAEKTEAAKLHAKAQELLNRTAPQGAAGPGG